MKKSIIICLFLFFLCSNVLQMYPMKRKTSSRKQNSSQAIPELPIEIIVAQDKETGEEILLSARKDLSERSLDLQKRKISLIKETLRMLREKMTTAEKTNTLHNQEDDIQKTILSFSQCQGFKSSFLDQTIKHNKYSGATLLHIATINLLPNVVKSLIASGANTKATFNNETAEEILISWKYYKDGKTSYEYIRRFAECMSHFENAKKIRVATCATPPNTQRDAHSPKVISTKKQSSEAPKPTDSGTNDALSHLTPKKRNNQSPSQKRKRSSSKKDSK